MYFGNNFPHLFNVIPKYRKPIIKNLEWKSYIKHSIICRKNALQRETSPVQALTDIQVVKAKQQNPNSIKDVVKNTAAKIEQKKITMKNLLLLWKEL